MDKMTILPLAAAGFGYLWAVGICTWAITDEDKPAFVEIDDCLEIKERPDDMKLYAGLACPGKPFWITAYIRRHRPGSPITLNLPVGLRLAEGESARQILPAPGERDYCEIKWRVIAASSGEYAVYASVPKFGCCRDDVRVREPCGCDF